MAMFEPTSEKLKAVKGRISSASWERRVAQARRIERKVLAIRRRVKRGEMQETAVRALVDKSQRSRIMRALVRYREKGFEGLFDLRTPREREVTAEQRQVIETARRMGGTADKTRCAARDPGGGRHQGHPADDAETHIGHDGPLHRIGVLPPSPDAVGDLPVACEIINQRKLAKGSRTLRFVVEWPSGH
jgi:hypothetical protein